MSSIKTLSGWYSFTLLEKTIPSFDDVFTTIPCPSFLYLYSRRKALNPSWSSSKKNSGFLQLSKCPLNSATCFFDNAIQLKIAGNYLRVCVLNRFANIYKLSPHNPVYGGGTCIFVRRFGIRRQKVCP